jgi:hypothetical protein
MLETIVIPVFLPVIGGEEYDGAIEDPLRLQGGKEAAELQIDEGDFLVVRRPDEFLFLGAQLQPPGANAGRLGERQGQAACSAAATWQLRRRSPCSAHEHLPARA